MRYLGIDYGLKSVGVAMGDDGGEAYPIEQIESREAVGRIVEIIEEDGVDEIVIGIPYDVHGKETEQSLLTRSFIEALKERLTTRGVELPIHEVDESLTSKESMRLQDETGTRVGKDALSAMLILRDYMSR